MAARKVSPLPRHVAFVMDGNRRYARRRGLALLKGHEAGKETLESLLGWCREFGIEELTVYAFSLQNFRRSSGEVEGLMRLFVSACEEFGAREDSRKGELRVRFVGRRDLLPGNVLEAVERLERSSASSGPFTLNVALAYGGREEVVDAVRAVAGEVADGSLEPGDIDEDVLSGHMWLSSEPDLIIRTGGERRTSNFLVWQSWYSEWVFLDMFWPEFSRSDFVACLEEYAGRQRRRGR